MENMRTYIMVKPDGVKRGLVGEIISRFERRGMRLVDAKLMNVSEELATQHYIEHKAKPFFGELVEYITSGPVFAMIWEAEDAVTITRSMMGPTKPATAAPGTIRGDFALSVEANVIHGSDSPESAAREIGLFFGRSKND